MPFLAQDDEELKKQQQAGPQNISGQSSVLSGPTAPKSEPGQNAKSGSWTNLQTYLDANKDQAKAMGEKVVGGVENKAKEAETNIGTFQSNAPTQANKVTTESVTSDYLANPSSVRKEEWAKLTGGYQGPQSIENVRGYNEAQKATSTANAALGQLGNEAGRTALLGQEYKRPNYTQGAKNLDNLLLQNDPTAKGAAQATTQKWSNLTNMLSGATDTAGQNINANKVTAGENAQTALGAADQYVKDFYDQLDQAAKTQFQKNKDFQTGVYSDITDDIFQQDFSNLSGIGPGEYLYNLNMKDYLTPNATQLTANDMATPEQVTAWQDLMGMLDTTDERIKGGGVNAPAMTFDKEKFRADQAREAAVDAAAMTELSPKQYIRQGGGFSQNMGSFQELLGTGMSPAEYLIAKNPDISGGVVDQAALNYVNANYGDIIGQMTADLSRIRQRKSGPIQLNKKLPVATPPAPSKLFGGLK